jgi:hypothetical protein
MNSSSLISQTQDTILLKSGTKIIADVTAISDTEVRYKELSSPDGPEYILSKNSIEKINFSSGDVKVFSLKRIDQLYGQNIISYHIFDVIYQDFTIAYEFITDGGMTGIRVPLTFGFNTENDREGPFSFRNLVSTGMGFNIYLLGQRRASYFMGPELDFGLGRRFNYDYYNFEEHFDKTDFIYGRLLINNGISISPVSNFRLSAMLGIGIRYFDLAESQEGGVKSSAYFTFSMGYRF